MAYVPGFDSDIFISYAHLDNQAVGTEGWVSHFHRRLKVELDAALGVSSAIWRDPQIGRSDSFAREIGKKLKSTAVLLAIVSPSYRESRWCDLELERFVTGEHRTGDLWVDTKCRAIKVIRRPVPEAWHRTILVETLGFEFFETDQLAGKTYEVPIGSDRFQRSIADVADEVSQILMRMRRMRTVFLGTAPAELVAQRNRISRELEARHFRVTSGDADQEHGVDTVRGCINESRLAIHFVNSPPDGLSASDSISAAERKVADETGVPQVVVVHRPSSPPQRLWENVPVKETNSDVEILVDPATHALNETVLQKLSGPVEFGKPKRLVRVYLVCDRRDHPLLDGARARAVRDHLRNLGFEIKMPLADSGNGSEYSKDNRSKLRQCDAVLLYWGGSGQGWFDGRLAELQQAKGWRSGREFGATAAYIAEPQNQVKENYETREVDELIKQFNILDLSDARFERFITKLAQLAQSEETDTDGSSVRRK